VHDAYQDLNGSSVHRELKHLDAAIQSVLGLNERVLHQASPMLQLARIADKQISEATLRSFLGSFGFSGERMDTPAVQSNQY
jgi:hypothetical protein